MTWSTNFYRNGRSAAAGLLILCCFGCATQRPAATRGEGRTCRIAVLPIENLSASRAPLKQLRETLKEKLRQEGFPLLDDGRLNDFMSRHRIRYTGGIDEESAMALAREENVEGVLVTSLENYQDSFPPKMAVTARLVAARKDPEILWIDSVGMAGNDAPGLFNVGVVTDPAKLADRLLERVAGSLGREYASGFRGESLREAAGFPPQKWYRGEPDQMKPGRLVVLPFYNRTGRKYAGEIMTLHLMREMKRVAGYRVVEPGVVRNELLQYRVIMEEGVSLANADVIYTVVGGATGILTGKVLAYEDPPGDAGVPRIDFSVAMLAKEKRMLVFSAQSYHSGDERVIFFDFGKVTTACELANRMAHGVGGLLAAGQAR